MERKTKSKGGWGGETDGPIVKDGEILMEEDTQMGKWGGKQERGSDKDETYQKEREKERETEWVRQAKRNCQGKTDRQGQADTRTERGQMKGKMTKEEREATGTQERRKENRKKETPGE